MLNKHDLCCHREDLSSEMTSCDSQSKANVAYDAYHPMKKARLSSLPAQAVSLKKMYAYHSCPARYMSISEEKTMLSILSVQAKSDEEMQSCKCSEALGLSTWEALWGGLIGLSVIAVDEKNV